MATNTKTSCNVLKDEEIQDLVTKLKRDVRERNSQLRALQSEVQTIRDEIQEREKERQIFSSNIICMDEAAKLIEEHKQLKEALQSKQRTLSSLQDGSSQEQRELEKEKELLERIENDRFQAALVREQNTATIRELKRQYEEKVELCKSTISQLDKVKQDISALKELIPNQKIRPKKPLSVRLDHLIMKSCRQAGLQL